MGAACQEVGVCVVCVCGETVGLMEAEECAVLN